MNTTEKGIGVAAIIMAVCCAVLPLAGRARSRRRVSDAKAQAKRMLTTIDRIYTAAMAARARGWIEPFLASFADERNRSRDPFVYAVGHRRGT
jgi:hypothetical protein